MFDEVKETWVLLFGGSRILVHSLVFRVEEFLAVKIHFFRTIIKFKYRVVYLNK